MIRTETLRQNFSHAKTYVEIYASISASHSEPIYQANYIWTFALERSVDGIPRDEKGRQVFPRGV